ncbi:MAG: aminotransferase class I/II-fold pyridoxal phosphate-dependent enzyme [Nanoarchaeota archaeon]|nr:aminotransferase class I/II-fold pyridoxal phosphate-dependent enzyme [Nanoarchaeota archaeon]
MNLDPNLTDLTHGEEYPLVLRVKQEFTEAVAQTHGVDARLVLPNNGSNGSLLTILSAYAVKALSEGMKPTIVYDVPQYFRTVHIARQFQYERIEIPRDAELEFDAAAYLAALERKPTLAVLTTPNNPTGKAIPDTDLDAILRALPDETVALIDRTLTNLDSELPTEELLGYQGKVIVLHSFSKSHHLSASRVGYAVTNSEEVADYVRPKLNLGFNVDGLRAGMAALRDTSRPEEVRKRIRASLEALDEAATLPGVRYFPSRSNYAVLQLPEGQSANHLRTFMEEKGFAIMAGPEIGMRDRYVRLHMTGAREIREFVSHLGIYLKK